MGKEMRTDVPCCNGQPISVDVDRKHIEPLPFFRREGRFVGDFCKGVKKLLSNRFHTSDDKPGLAHLVSYKGFSSFE